MGQTTSTTVATPSATQQAGGAHVAVGKSGKKICCSCPDTKKLRDECIIQNGEEACKQFIEAHKDCLRAEGFTVK